MPERHVQVEFWVRVPEDEDLDDTLSILVGETETAIQRTRLAYTAPTWHYHPYRETEVKQVEITMEGRST